MSISGHPSQNFNDELFAFIKARESGTFAAGIYPDSRGIPTIGHGFALLVNVGSATAPKFKPRDLAEINAVLNAGGVNDTVNSGDPQFRGRNSGDTIRTQFRAQFRGQYT